MQTFQDSIKTGEKFDYRKLDFLPDLILLFVSSGFDNIESFVWDISTAYPNAIISGCSTSGEINNIKVDDNTVVFNAIRFDSTQVSMASKNVRDFKDSESLGKALSKDLITEDLKHVLIFSEGLLINGDDLVTGLSSEINQEIGITGGMAGDGTDFNKTFVIKQNKVLVGEVVGIGLHGSALKVGYSSQGGWNSFGIERKVTKSDKNVLYEIDGQPALKLYKSFLGEKAADLPGTGLLFPLSLRVNENSTPLVRTLLNIDEENQSIIFAGNIPEGSFVRLMKANVDRLISGAEGSAMNTKASLTDEPEFALLISCVGRRVVLKQLVEEEVEAVREVLGDKPVMSGFYSYGEMAPFGKSKACRLHNQTMTITTLSEN